MNEKLESIFTELDQLEKEKIDVERYSKIYQNGKLLLKYGFYDTKEIKNYDDYYVVHLKGPKLFLNYREYDICIHKEKDEVVFLSKEEEKSKMLVFDDLNEEEIEKLRRYDNLKGKDSSKDFNELIKEEAKKKEGYPPGNNYRNYAMVYSLIVIFGGIFSVVYFGIFAFIGIFMAMILPVILFGIAEILDILKKK